MFASAASNPRSGRDIDAEHGSGTADPENIELGRVNWRGMSPATTSYCFRPLLLSAHLNEFDWLIGSRRG